MHTAGTAIPGFVPSPFGYTHDGFEAYAVSGAAEPFLAAVAAVDPALIFSMQPFQPAQMLTQPINAPPMGFVSQAPLGYSLPQQNSPAQNSLAQNCLSQNPPPSRALSRRTLSRGTLSRRALSHSRTLFRSRTFCPRRCWVKARRFRLRH